MPRGSSATRSANLASRIEATAVNGPSTSACITCRRLSRQCIRSIISVRCSSCVRLNRRCIPFTPRSSRNAHVAAVRADIRRLRASLNSLDRFVSFSAVISRESSSPVSVDTLLGASSSCGESSDDSDASDTKESDHSSNDSDTPPAVVDPPASPADPLGISFLLNPSSQGSSVERKSLLLSVALHFSLIALRCYYDRYFR
jgi:hypothetical protein